MKAMVTEMHKRSMVIRRVATTETEVEESPSGADKEQEGNNVDTAVLHNHGPAIASPLTTIKDEMQVIFIRLLFSRMVVKKIVEDSGIVSLKTLTSLSAI